MSKPVIDIVQVFRSELQLCKLKPGEIVGIYSENGQRRAYAESFARAAADLGASSFHIDLPVSGGKNLSKAIGGRAENRGLAAIPAALKALQECDLMIDLTLILFEPELAQIQAAGTRVVSCVEQPDVLARLLPDTDQRRRAEESLRLLGRARTMRVTSDAGTDVTYEFGDHAPFCQYGYSDEPGRWDHFPSTFVVHCANEDGVNGCVVLKPGDVIFPSGRYVNELIEIAIKDGFITSIKGGADALLLRDVMAASGDREAYGISHIGWGLNEKARWDALVLNRDAMGMDNRGYEGCVMFATGPNTEFGGNNHSPCHFDIPMRDCTVYVDGGLIVESGRVTHEAVARRGVRA